MIKNQIQNEVYTCQLLIYRFFRNIMENGSTEQMQKCEVLLHAQIDYKSIPNIVGMSLHTVYNVNKTI